MTTQDVSQAPNVVDSQAVDPTSSPIPPVFRISRADRVAAYRWTHHELSYDQFRERFEHHISRASKDGACFMPAEFIGEQRTTKAVTALYAVVFDVDHEQILDDVIANAERSGYVVFVYTTFSHMKTETHVSADVFWKWLKTVEPNVQPNATGHHTQARMEAYVAEQMAGKVPLPFTVAEKMIQTADGTCIVLSHAPVQKSRIVFPLASPFVMLDNGMTSEMQSDAWKQTYTGIARALGYEFDDACTDPARVFYFPSCPVGSEDLHKIVIFDGEGRTFLDYTKFEKAPLEDVKKTKAAKTKAPKERPAKERVTSSRVTRTVSSDKKTPDATLLDSVRTALNSINPNIKRPEWLSVIYGVHAMFAESSFDDAAMKLVDEWSSGGANYKDGEVADIWVKADPTGGAGPGSFWHIAREHGYLPDDIDGEDESEEEKPKQTKAWLKAKLTTEDTWAVTAMLVLYDLQTEDEKFGQGAGKQNGIGFNKNDATRLSPFVEKWNNKTPLSRGELNVVKRRVSKYAGTQLLTRLEMLEDRVSQVEDVIDEMTSNEADDLPSAYFRDTDDDTGETRIFTNGEKNAIEVCQDFTVRAATLDTKAHHGIGIRFTDRRGKPRDVFFKQGELAGKGTSWLEALSDEGFESYNDGKLRDLLRRLRTDKVALRVGKPGWHLHNGREEFVLPDSAIDDVVYVGRVEHVRRDPNGSLERWQETAKLAEGNSRLEFALGAAFVGPCLKLFNAESGGCLLAGKSSEGKSAALCLNASVWGPGPVSLKATPTSIESVLEEMNDCGGSLDELGEMEHGAGDVAYMAGNGFGKSRGKPNGERQDVRTFRVSVLFSGEMSLADKIESENKRLTGGQETRVVTVPSNAGAGYGIFDKVPRLSGNATSDGAAFAERIKAETKCNYGHAGPAFVEWMKNNRDQVIAEFGNLAEIADALTPADAEPQARRVARRFALVIVAGELAIEAGILPLKPNSVLKATHRLFHDWLEQRGGAAQTEALQGARRIWEHMKQHPRDFESMATNGQVNNNFAQPTRRLGYADSDGRTFYWFTHAFKDVAKTGAVVDVAKYLHQKGGLDKDAGKGWTKSKKINGTKDRYYAVRIPDVADAGRTWIDDLLSQQQPEIEDFDLADDVI